MQILHYALGFPPYRSGGLTKFCMDLMKQQNAEGHHVALVWPGQMGLINKNVSVKDRGDILLGNCRIRSFEIINPLPVSYDEGINQFDAFTTVCDKKIYSQFICLYKPDVFHIHTLMGLHKNFLEIAKEKGIKLIFTTHDFFPICPKVVLFKYADICKTAKSCEDCSICNATALGIKKIQILQSPLYRMLKDSAVVKYLRKKHRDNYLSEAVLKEHGKPIGTPDDYKKLRIYYASMLKLMDIIHYNSSITKEVYEKYFGFFKNQVIGISHGNIEDHKKLKIFSDDKIRMRYLGPYGGAKGFFILRQHLIGFGKKNRIFV